MSKKKQAVEEEKITVREALFFARRAYLHGSIATTQQMGRAFFGGDKRKEKALPPTKRFEKWIEDLPKDDPFRRARKCLAQANP